MNVNEIFTAEWLAKFKLNNHPLEQVQSAMADYVAKSERMNEIRTLIGKRPENLETIVTNIAKNVTPGEIVNNYPGMVARELEKMEKRLADFNTAK